MGDKMGRADPYTSLLASQNPQTLTASCAEPGTLGVAGPLGR